MREERAGKGLFKETLENLQKMRKRREADEPFEAILTVLICELGGLRIVEKRVMR